VPGDPRPAVRSRLCRSAPAIAGVARTSTVLEARNYDVARAATRTAHRDGARSPGGAATRLRTAVRPSRRRRIAPGTRVHRGRHPIAIDRGSFRVARGMLILLVRDREVFDPRNEVACRLRAYSVGHRPAPREAAPGVVAPNAARSRDSGHGTDPVPAADGPRNQPPSGSGYSSRGSSIGTSSRDVHAPSTDAPPRGPRRGPLVVRLECAVAGRSPRRRRRRRSSTTAGKPRLIAMRSSHARDTRSSETSSSSVCDCVAVKRTFTTYASGSQCESTIVRRDINPSLAPTAKTCFHSGRAAPPVRGTKLTRPAGLSPHGYGSPGQKALERNRPSVRIQVGNRTTRRTQRRITEHAINDAVEKLIALVPQVVRLARIV